MRKITYFLGLTVCLFLASCKEEPVVIETETQPSQTSELTNAINLAKNMIIQSSSADTRSAERIPSEIIPLNKPTRSGEEGTKIRWYAVNFEDNQGYCIVSPDSLKSPVAAFSPSESFPTYWADMPEFMQFYIDFICDLSAAEWDSSDIDANDADSPQLSSPRKIGIGDDGRVPYPGDPKVEEIIYVVNPLIQNTAEDWDQRHPYNLYCPRKWNPVDEELQHSLAGCSAVASAILMSHFEWPPYYEQTRFNWTYMKQDTDGRAFTALLLMELGKQPNLNINYGLTGSGAELKNFAPAFRNFYYMVNDWRNSNEADVINTLTIGNPIMMYGSGYNYRTQSISAHTWVIDGYYIRKLNDLAEDPNYSTYDYFRCIWGWKGQCNGYFRLGNRISVNQDGMNVYYENFKCFRVTGLKPYNP